MEKQIFIDGIETNYTVTDDGVVKNSKTGRIMTINNGNVQLISMEKVRDARSVKL